MTGRSLLQERRAAPAVPKVREVALEIIVTRFRHDVSRSSRMKPFYDRSEAERIALTERAISQGGSLLERWSALADREASSWNARASAAGEWLAGENGVLDMGCGTMALEQFIDDAQYFPCDICARDFRTIVCDLNKHPVPIVQATAVASLGLLEYVHDPRDLMRSLCRLYETAVVSYCTADAPVPLVPRKAHAWVNDFTCSEIEELFLDTGWAIADFRQLDDVQGLWKLNSLCVRDTKSLIQNSSA